VSGVAQRSRFWHRRRSPASGPSAEAVDDPIGVELLPACRWRRLGKSPFGLHGCACNDNRREETLPCQIRRRLGCGQPTRRRGGYSGGRCARAARRALAADRRQRAAVLHGRRARPRRPGPRHRRPLAGERRQPGRGHPRAGLRAAGRRARHRRRADGRPTPFRLDRFDGVDPREIATSAADAIFELSTERFTS
jgi:hypothetical protein